MKNLVERQIFEKIRAKNPNNIVMPFLFRSELPLGNSVQNYKFPLLKEDSVNVAQTENRINKNDTFFALSVGLAVVRRQVGKEGLDVLQTYPNPSYFPDVAGQFDNTHLETVYNGQMDVEINSIKVIEGLSTQVFRSVPQTQQNSADNFSQKDIESIMFPLAKHIKLYGSETNTIRVVIPSFAGMKIQDETALATIENRVVFLSYGFLIKGAKGNDLN